MTILKKLFCWWNTTGSQPLPTKNSPSPSKKKRKYRIRKIGDQFKVEYWNGTTYLYLKSGFPSLAVAEAWLDNLTTADFQDATEKTID